jgi:hypothetical protein
LVIFGEKLEDREIPESFREIPDNFTRVGIYATIFLFYATIFLFLSIVRGESITKSLLTDNVTVF